MDLSKAFDCIPCDLLIMKLAAYRLQRTDFLLLIYLKILRQCVRLKTSYSGFKGIISWVLQGSITSPFLLNTFFKSFLLLHFTSFCISIADDNKL